MTGYEVWRNYRGLLDGRERPVGGKDFLSYMSPHPARGSLDAESYIIMRNTQEGTILILVRPYAPPPLQPNDAF